MHIITKKSTIRSMISRKEFSKAIEEICALASKDSGFRAQCLSEPSAILEKFLGQALSGDIHIRFIDSDDTVVRLPPFGFEPISDEEPIDSRSLPFLVTSPCGMAVGRCSGKEPDTDEDEQNYGVDEENN